MMKFASLPDAVKSIDEGHRAVDAWVSRETVDRDSEVLKADGATFADFLRNPVVLWMHDRKTPPIGKAVDIRAIPGEGVEATTEFAPTALGDEMWQLYRGGFLKAFSVGFKVTDATQEPVMDGQRGPTIYAWDIQEYSGVTIPSNADALVKAADAGSDFAGVLLKHFFPDDKDAIESARIACDIRRLTGAAQALVNITAHYRKLGLGCPVPPCEVAKAKALIEQLSPPPIPETHPAPGDPSEQPDWAVLTEAVAELRSLADSVPSRVASALKTERQRYIGGRHHG